MKTMKICALVLAGSIFGFAKADSNDDDDYFRIQHVGSGNCLGFEGTAFEPSNNAKAIQMPCWPNAPKFYYDKRNYRLQMVDTNMCLDGYLNPVVAHRCRNNDADQQWLPTPVVGMTHADYFILSNGGREGQLDDDGTTHFQLETGDVDNDAKWFILPADKVMDIPDCDSCNTHPCNPDPFPFGDWMELPPYPSSGCASRPPGHVCIGFSDGYIWLVNDSIQGWHDSIQGWHGTGTELVCAVGFKDDYCHLIGTNYICSGNCLQL